MMAKSNSNKKASSAQLFNFTKDSYLERTSRPIYSLLFLLPFIVFYELGTLFVNTDVLNRSQIRVVAFVWLQNFLEWAGLGSRLAWMMPAVTIIVLLLALQLTCRKSWYFTVRDFLPMGIECVIFASPLIVLSLFLNSSAQYQSADIGLVGNSTVQSIRISNCYTTVGEDDTAGNDEDESMPAKPQSLLTNLVTSVGAGIYEELVFRLILICLLMVLFQNVLHLGQKESIMLSVIISAVLFSLHHHVIFVNGEFTQIAAFSGAELFFRTIAGVYFAVLFAVRGFGITAGAHAVYDIMAVFINIAFFDH